MATNIDSSFIDLWNAEVHHDFQQRGSKLREACRLVTGVTGNTHNFHKVGAVAANQKSARDADLTALNPDQAVATATMVDYYAPIYIDQLDEVKTNADFRREFVTTSTAAIGRALDGNIIAALDATHGTAAEVDATAGLTYELLLQAKRVLDEADAPMEDRFLVISPQGLEALMKETEVTSGDYQTVKALVRGEIDTALGFKWIMSNQLNLNVGTQGADVRSCYAFQKSAVGCAVGYDIKTTVDRIPQKANYLVNTMMSAGSVAIDTTGIVEITITEV